MSRDSGTLEIEGPSATCGYCRFTSALIGSWSVEDGRLVFRADPDPQPRRGPDLTSCCEGWECGEFGRITVIEGTAWTTRALSAEDVAALRSAVTEAQAREAQEWAEREQ